MCKVLDFKCACYTKFGYMYEGQLTKNKQTNKQRLYITIVRMRITHKETINE